MSSGMNKALFLDRDGVINEVIFRNGKPASPRKIQEFKVKQNTIKIIDEYSKKYLIFVVSNQPDVKRGNMDIKELNKMNDFLLSKMNIKEIVNETEDNKDFKKPNPYMILELCKKYNIDKKQSFIVGDRWVDILAGKKSGVKTILLEKDYSNDETSLGRPPLNLSPDNIIKNLDQLREII